MEAVDVMALLVVGLLMRYNYHAFRRARVEQAQQIEAMRREAARMPFPMHV